MPHDASSSGVRDTRGLSGMPLSILFRTPMSHISNLVQGCSEHGLTHEIKMFKSP